jgi:hypothetical protein
VSEPLGVRLFARKAGGSAVGEGEDVVILSFLQAPAEPTVAAIWRRVSYPKDHAPTFESYGKLLVERVGFKGQVRSWAGGMSESFRWSKSGKPDVAQRLFNVLDKVSSTPIDDDCVVTPPPEVDATGAPFVDGYRDHSYYTGSAPTPLGLSPAPRIGVRSHCGISLAAEFTAGSDNPALVTQAAFFLLDQGGTLKNLDDRRAWLLAKQSAKQADEAVKARANAPAM